MKTKHMPHIVTSVLAVFAAAVLFVTYGTVLPAAPFAPIQLNGPTVVDSDGSLTAVVDTSSRHALIMNADNDLTGVVDCATIDSPFDAITDVSVVGGYIFLSGVTFQPDSDVIERERVAVYDKGGNFISTAFEVEGTKGVQPSIKSLSNASDGVVVALLTTDSLDGAAEGEGGDEAKSENPSFKTVLKFVLLADDGEHELNRVDEEGAAIHDAAFSANGSKYYATLDVLGKLDDADPSSSSRRFGGYVFTAIDIDNQGTVYACDDGTGALCSIAADSSDVRELVPGSGYNSVHNNNGVVSLCSAKANSVVLCDASGNIASEFSEVKPSGGFSARMTLVWASGLYLALLAVVIAVRKLRQSVREGKTENIGPLFLSIAVVSAFAIAIGNLSFSSYQRAFEQRANEIDVFADYLESIASDLSGAMEKANTRTAFRESDERFDDAVTGLIGAVAPVASLVYSANDNGVGVYYNVYGKDDRGVFYLYGSADEFVLGTSVNLFDDNALEQSFEGAPGANHQLYSGRTLRDETQYRLVQIPSPDGKSVIGVLEIGSKMHSFESSITRDLARHILALLVMVLVVYLTYSELRACTHCLFDYRQRHRQDATGAISVLTRPFTLAITLLSSIDSVMTVLIARDLLAGAGMDTSSPLLAVPAVMLGVGLVIGQVLYGFAGSRVGLRRLVAGGAFAMLLCACFTGATVALNNFWLYCIAKLAMSVPFGMLYALGYSLPRLARNDADRVEASGGVRRTDTSAAALGTVLGGYAAQTFGNGWVYVLVAIACLVVIVLAFNQLPRELAPLETLAQPEQRDGRIRDFVKTPTGLAIALLVVLPATVAAGYASFLFPLFSIDLGLQKSDINNIFVLGQLVVYVCIGTIDRMESRYGRWQLTGSAIALLGMVFLLFSVNTTLVWSLAVVALVALLCKSSDGWKALWLKAAGEVGVPTGRATGAMFATRSLALVAQPFILGALLGATDSVAVIVIGALCVVCAALFFLVTRRTSLNSKQVQGPKNA